MKKVYNSIMLSVLLLSTVFMGTACSDDNDETGLNKYPAPTITEFYPNNAVPIKTVESNKTLNIIELYTFFIFAILLNKFITIEDFVISEDSI